MLSFNNPSISRLGSILSMPGNACNIPTTKFKLNSWIYFYLITPAISICFCRFRAITSSYYRGALGALLVYDITRRNTFESLKKWLYELREYGNPEMVVVLIGNKSDLSASRQVAMEDGQTLAQLEGLCFMETSAKENLNVEEAFYHMITKIHEITSQKSLEAKMNNETSTNSTLQGGKQIINVNVDEVSATKHTNSCCT